MSENKKPIPKKPIYKKAIVLTPKQIAFIEEKAGRNSLVQIAHMLGISETTIHVIKNRQPGVNEAYARGRARAVDLVASAIFNAAIQGDKVLAPFYMRCMGGWTEKPNYQIEEEQANLNVNVTFRGKPEAKNGC